MQNFGIIAVWQQLRNDWKLGWRKLKKNWPVSRRVSIDAISHGIGKLLATLPAIETSRR
jgi:hypothetical protein